MLELHPQFLTGPDGNPFVVPSLTEYGAVIDQLEDLEDTQAAAQALRELAGGAKPLSLAALDEYLTDALDH